jgi:Ca2+-binding RTX toxin-like protein
MKKSHLLLMRPEVALLRRLHPKRSQFLRDW